MNARTRRKFAFVLPFFALLVAGPAHAQDARLHAFGGAKQFVQYAKVALSPEQERELRKFRKEVSYFGAFAVNAESGAWGNSAGYFSQRIAEQGAIAICQGFSNGKPCKIIAAILPGSVPAGSRGGVGLSAAIEKFYADGYLTEVARQKPGRYAAFALGGRAAAFETNAKSAHAAQLKARRTCERAELRNQRKVLVQVRNAFNKIGAYTCTIADMRGPSN